MEVRNARRDELAQLLGMGRAYAGSTVTLESIAVKEPFRRRGLGRRLPSTSEEHARHDGGRVDVGSRADGRASYLLAHNDPARLGVARSTISSSQRPPSSTICWPPAHSRRWWPCWSLRSGRC